MRRAWLAGAPCGTVLRRGPGDPWPSVREPEDRPRTLTLQLPDEGESLSLPGRPCPHPQYQDGTSCLTGLFEDEDRE